MSQPGAGNDDLNAALREYASNFYSEIQKMQQDLLQSSIRSFAVSPKEKSPGTYVGTIPVQRKQVVYDFDKKINEAADKLNQYKTQSQVEDFSKEIHNKASLVDTEAKRLDGLKEGTYVKQSR